MDIVYNTVLGVMIRLDFVEPVPDRGIAGQAQSPVAVGEYSNLIKSAATGSSMGELKIVNRCLPVTSCHMLLL